MENITIEPVFVVKIKDVTGAIQKFTVKSRPRWDGDLIYVTESERGLILFNSQNVVSYSEKIVIPKRRGPLKAELETPSTAEVTEDQTDEEN